MQENNYINFNELVKQKREYNAQLKAYNEQMAQIKAQEEKERQAKEARENANFFERAWQTTVDFVGQVGVGVSKGIEGIIDFGSGIVGGIGGLFDKDFQEQVKKNIAYDWTYNNIQKPLADATQKSYINDASQGVKNVIRGVPNALGQIAPALVAGPAGLPTLMASSAGSGMEEAFADGADYYKGLLYGSVTGAVEGAIEKISGGMAKSVFGKGLADNIFEKIAGNAYATKGVKYLLDAGGEALEEYVSTSINPYIKRMTYDPNAELSTQQERLESALIGGLASMGYRSTIGKVGEKKTDVLENVQTIQETQQQANQEWGKGKLTDARYEKYNNRIERAYQTASARLKEMKSDKRQKFMQKYGLDKMFDLDGNIIGRPTQNVGQNQTVSSGVINSSQNAKFTQNGAEINAERGVNTQINGQAIQNAQFSIKKDADGNEYVNIDTDQHLFDGKNASEMQNIAKQVIQQKFQGQTINGATINLRSRNEYLNSEYTKAIKSTKKSAYEVKMRGATEIDNLLSTAKFLRHENAKHPKPFNKDGYDIYQVDFELNGNKFSGELLVAINENERKFYDIVKIKNRTTPRPTNKLGANTVQDKTRTVGGSNPINNSIRNNSEKVNKNSQKNEKNLKNNANNAKNQAKSSQNTAPKASLTKQDSAKNATASVGKPNRDAYSPMLWNKEDSLLYKPTSKELTAEQKETLKYFTQMNSYRNFALVCITDELPANENGVYKDGIIYVSRTSKDPMQVTLMHEMTHYLEKSKAYDEYAKYILSDLTKEKSVLKHINDITGNNWTVQEIIDRYSKVYNNVEDIKSEIIAIYTSEYMFTDLYAMARMGVKKKGLLQKIHNFAWSVGEYFKNKSNKTKQEHSVNKFLQNAQKLYKNALNNATAIVNQNTLSANDDKEYKVIEQAKYSVADADADLQNTDNKGNVLSKEQKEFFKNSKVIDSKGQLKVCYHGSGATFNVFNYDKLGANGTAEGKGFYFTDSKEYSQAYKTDNEESKVYETYINIEKPLNTQKITISRSEIKKFIKGIDPDGYDYLSNYGDVEFEGYNAVLNQAVDSEFSYNDNDVDLIHSILNSSKYQDELEIFYDKLREILGYDGIIQDWGENTKRREEVGIWYIVFNANQIKEITNKTPTKSDDIRYSLTKDVDKNAQNDVNSNKGVANGQEREYENGREEREATEYNLVRNKGLSVSFDDGRVRLLSEIKISKRAEERLEDFVNSIYTLPHSDTQSALKWHANKENLNLYFVELREKVDNFYVMDNDELFIDENATEKDLVDILNVEKPIIRNLDPKKIAHISQERWNKFLQWRPDAFLTRMPIQQFLDMTTDSYVTQRQINAVSRQISQNAENIKNTSGEYMYLEVDFDKSKVVSHEGRHRATALLNAGNTYIDIFVIPTKMVNFESKASIAIQGQYVNNKYNLGLIRAQNKQLEEAIKATFLNNDANIKYSLTKDVDKNAQNDVNYVQVLTHNELWKKLSKQEQAIFYRKIDEIHHQDYFANTLENGDVVLDVENKIIISNGEFDKPSIECIIEFNSETGKISEARDYFYEIYNGRTIWECVEVINYLCKEKVANLYGQKGSNYDSQFARQNEINSGLDGISELNGRRAEIPSGTSEDGTKYSITKGEYNKAMANYRREKVYSRKESAQIIEEIVSKELNINADYYGIITAKDKGKVITKLFEDLNGVKPSELQAELNKIADIIITESKYRNIYEDLEQVDLTGYDAIKSYMHKLNITSLKEEIKHRYDTDGARTINLLWSAGENKGVSVEDAIEELREQGVYIEANNDVDAFFELLDTYDNLKSQVNAKIEEYKSDDFSADELNDLRKRIVSGLEKEIANAGKTSKIANMKAYYNAQVERMRADRKTAYLYSRSLVRLKTAYDRLKNLKNTPADEMLLPIVEEIVKAMQKTMTYTGNLNKNMRTILRDEFSPIHKKLVELSDDNDNPYLQVLSEIANKPSNENITPEEMSLLAQVFENTIHLVKNYDRAFWQGKVQKESELAERAVSETDFAKDYIPNDVIYNKIFLSYANPQDVFNSLTCEGEDGFMAQAFQEIISSEIEKQTILSKVDYRLKEIEQKHKKEMKTWDKQDIDFKGKQISRGQQITLVMMWEREQARQHLENGGSVVLNEKYMGKEDYKRAVYEPTLKAVITQEDIDSLKTTLTEAQKDYIKFAEYVFNDVCKNAKYETDIALRGVSNIESGKYIPIEVADDEIAKRIGSEYSEDATINKRMQSVYSYSANKATKVGAKNAVVIDDIRRVLRRHTEDMATYAGYGKCINSLNRIMNRKTADGRTLKTALNEANTNILPYIQKLLKDVQGINKGRDNVQKFLDVVRNYSYKATLGLNLKSWAMQTLSLFSARGGGLKYGNLAEGFAKFIAHPKVALQELDSTNALAHARFRDGFNTDVGRAMSEIGYLGKFDKVTDKLMAPMQKIDQWMCGAIWEACKIQTKNDLQKANDLFTKVLIKTQANWTPAFRPQILRSDNALVKFFTIYMSEPLQLFSRLSSSVLELKKLTKMKKSDRYRSDADFAKRVDGQLKEARDNFITQTTNVLGSMTLSTMIAVAFKELLKTTGDDDDEEFMDRLLPEFGANVFGMLPIMRNIYSILQGYEITNSAYTGLTNIVNAGKNMWDLSEMLISGRQYTSAEIASIIRQTANGLAQTFGIPLRNAEKYAKAFIDLVSPETAYKWNSAFKSRSTSAYYTALEKASGNESLQAVITQTLLRDKGVAVGSESVRDEMLRLFNMGINALPRSVATRVTYNDEKIELTQSQYKQVQNAYNKASEQADKLLATKEYANASDEVKGTALKKLYDYYYDLAMQEITKSDYSKFGLFAQGMDAYKLAIYSAQINEIKKQYQNTSNSALKNASTNTLKNQIINYVNKLSLNSTQKYMLLGYCGYKNANGANQVKAYINRLNLTKEQKETLYTYSGYIS